MQSDQKQARKEERYELNFHSKTPQHHTKFLENNSTDILSLNSQHSIHILSPSEPIPIKHQQINPRIIFDNLSTSWLAHTIIHSPLISSTQDIFKHILAPNWTSSTHGYVATATTQSAARGRRGTTWVSPFGSVALTLCVTFNMHTVDTTSHLTFIQYIAALAICKSCKSILASHGNQDDITIKWPNDVFKNEHKIAGVLCEASMNGHGECNVYVGVGVNICNSVPTIPLLENHEADDIRELFIATFLNDFEIMYEAFIQNGFEHSGLLAQYLRQWMHSNQHVTIGNVNGPKAVVKGLAPNGWVRVLRSDLNAFQDLPPESTSLDMRFNVLKDKQSVNPNNNSE